MQFLVRRIHSVTIPGVAKQGASSGLSGTKTCLAASPPIFEDRSSPEGAFLAHGFESSLRLPPARPLDPSFRRVVERVNAMDRAVIPPDPALTLRFCSVLLVFAVFTMDGPESSTSTELHPSRFLGLVAQAAGKEATGVGGLATLPRLVASRNSVDNSLRGSSVTYSM